MRTQRRVEYVSLAGAVAHAGYEMKRRRKTVIGKTRPQVAAAVPSRRPEPGTRRDNRVTSFEAHVRTQ